MGAACKVVEPQLIQAPVFLADARGSRVSAMDDSHASACRRTAFCSKFVEIVYAYDAMKYPFLHSD